MYLIFFHYSFLVTITKCSSTTKLNFFINIHEFLWWIIYPFPESSSLLAWYTSYIHICIPTELECTRNLASDIWSATSGKEIWHLTHGLLSTFYLFAPDIPDISINIPDRDCSISLCSRMKTTFSRARYRYLLLLRNKHCS